MEVFEILCDTREQKPWQFDDYPTSVRRVTLRTGDYALARHCNYDAENDTYLPTLAVERKSGPDFLQSITRGRDRFKREIKRAAEWRDPMYVIIESPRRVFAKKQGFMRYRNVHPNQVFGTTEAWGDHYNVSFHFAQSRDHAERLAFDKLADFHRNFSSVDSTGPAASD